MKILVTGASGLVGSHLVDQLQKEGKHDLLTPPVEEFDITDASKVNEFFGEHAPQCIIHYAAHTFLDQAEKEQGDRHGIVWKINVKGTENLARAAAQKNSYFIHISTDNVFAGKKDDPGPYEENHTRETDEHRISWYGFTKVKAEEIVEQIVPRHAIVRIAYPVRAHYDAKLDHARKVIKAYEAGTLTPLFDDQYLTMTYINEATEAVKKLLDTSQKGIFHVSSTNVYTPFALADYLLMKKYGVTGVVKRGSFEEYVKKTGLENRYTQYGGLNTIETQKRLGISLGTWQQTIDKLIDEGI